MPANNIPYACLLLLAIAGSSFATTCWEGRNGVNTESVIYHLKVECDTNSFVCQRLYNSRSNLHEMSCGLPVLCEGEQKEIEAGRSSSWTEVICCDTELCNGYEGIGTDDAKSNTPTPDRRSSGGDRLSQATTSLLIVSTMGYLVLTLL